MTCSGCAVHHRLHTLDKSISSFYRSRGIQTHGDITLHVFDEMFKIQVFHRPGVTYTTFTNGRWNVWMDNSLNLYERRVRMAHEIAHMFLHSGNQLFGPELRRLKEEEQARRFSLYALAPTCFLFPLLSDDSDNPQRLCGELAEMFGVPAWFMNERLQRVQEDQVIELAYRY